MIQDTVNSSDRWLVIGAFVFSLLVFTAIGVFSSTRKKQLTSDYLLAGRDVSAWLVALSTVATINSGFMFVGQIGFTYRVGLSSIWMLVGWTIGDYLAWRFLYRRLRETSEERNHISALALLRPPRTLGRRLTVPVAGLITIFYLSMYAAAQLKAGSIALQSMFGMPAHTGAVIGALVIVIYCFSGGIRASIWTDAAQSMVMMASMAVLVFVAATQIGGPASLIARLNHIDPALTDLMPEEAGLGFPLYLLGMCFGGFGVIGQPHILVRSMCLRDPAEVRRARRYYFVFLIPFYIMAIGVGLHARVLLPQLAQSTTLGSEHALPMLSTTLLPSLLVGLVLAGLFSATMSTGDSLVIACSSAITQDIRPRWKDSYRASKIATVTVTAVALGIALGSADGVFALVLDAWGVLSCTLGPLMLLSLLGLPYSRAMGIAIMLSGFIVANLWLSSRHAGDIYVNLPGMLVAVATYGILLAVTRGRFAQEQGAAQRPSSSSDP
jgi:sodium/proline symporter